MDLDTPDGPVTTNKTKIQFKIEIYGDVVCPWCYLGKKSLDAAIETHTAKYPDDVFDIVWKPFILWPLAEVSAYSKKAPILGMVGPARAPGVFDRLAIAGAQYGIYFNWDGLVGNSADANKLVVLAYEIDQRLRERQGQQGEGEHSTSHNFLSTPPPEPPRTPATTKASLSYPSPGRRTSQLSPPPSSPPSPTSLSSSTKISSSVRGSPILNPTQHSFLEALFYETLTQGFDPSDRGFLISLALSMDPRLGASPSELVAYLDSEDANVRVGLSPARLSPLRATTSVPDTTKPPSPSSQKYTQQGGCSRDGEYTKEKEIENPYNGKKDLKAIINGVPNVVVQGRYRVGGFQKPDVYLAVFEKVREGLEFSKSGPRGTDGVKVTPREMG